MRVGITAGAWVVVLRTAIALVETVDTVVDVVVLERAGRPAIVLMVPKQRRRHIARISRVKLSVSFLTLCPINKTKTHEQTVCIR